MKAAILSVGTEILFGQITNTNTVYLSQQLNTMGFDVMYHYTVGDNPERLREMIRTALKDCDIVITTGGLGPTQDDLTKEIACETLDDSLVFSETSLNNVKSAFRKSNSKMTDNNLKQAYLPSRAVIFPNNHGTAPGFALESRPDAGEEDAKGCIICLPGPPREMKAMFEESARDFLRKKSGEAIYYRLIRTYGIGESSLETALLDLIDNQTDPTLATYAKEGECYVRIASKRATEEEAITAVDIMTDKVKSIVGGCVYSTDNEDLWEVVANRLIEKEISVSCAESCTGGLFAAMLTEIPGISAVFDRGLVTYSNQAKMSELGVKKETLEKFGAVSEETAAEMAQGLAEVSGSELCISVTGVAGPEGGSYEKPVGLAWICCVYNGKKVTKKFQVRDLGRHWNRNSTMLAMMNMVREMIS